MSRVVAITGASAGIGQATAIRLARDGASVAICARRRDRLEAVADEIVGAGGRALAIEADVTSEADMHRFVDRSAEVFGRLDVLVCNAGFGIYGAVDALAAGAMHDLMQVNYFGTYYAVRAALPLFRRQRAGHLIVVSSIVGKRGVPYMGAYAATKFAQEGLAECLRAELVGSRIHVSVVYPISTETEFFGVMQRRSGIRTQSAGPHQPPEAVANAIARAIERPVAEIYPYRIARGLVLLNSLAPAFCDRLVRRWGRKPIDG